MKKKVRRAPPPHDMRALGLAALFFFVVGAFIALPVASVSAQPPPTTWSIQVTEDTRCAQAPGFHDQLAGQIPPEQRASEADAELVAVVSVRRAERSQTAIVTVIDRVLGAPAGERSITLPLSDCAATADALALVIGVLVEAGRGAPLQQPREEEMEKEPEPPAEPPAPSSPAAEALRPTPPKKRYVWLGPRPGHDLTIGVGAGALLLPGVTWGGHFQWGLRVRGLWPIFMGATLYLPAETTDERAVFRAGYGSVATCPVHLSGGRWRARACPSFAAGMLKAEGRGFLESRKVKQPLVLVGAELASDLRIAGPLTVGLMARAEAPLMRPRFTYYKASGAEPALHQPKPVAISCYLTVGLRFR